MKKCSVCGIDIMEEMTFYMVNIIPKNNPDCEEVHDYCEECYSQSIYHIYDDSEQKPDVGDILDQKDNIQASSSINNKELIVEIKEEISSIEALEICVKCYEPLLDDNVHILRTGYITTELSKIIKPRKVCPGEKICQVCYEEVKSRVKKVQPVEKDSDYVPPKETSDTDDDYLPPIRNNTDSKERDYITLQNYRRVANTSRGCFVKSCKGKEKFNIPKYLRRVLLDSYKIFVPDHARLCKSHVKEYYRDWSFLRDSVKLTHFSSSHIECLLDLLNDK